MYNNLLIAHRGIHDNIKIPENSMLSFKKALEQKIPIELDLQLTKDNKVIVFHDDNLFRLTNINEKIENLTLEEINKLNLLNTKEKIPTLKDVLKLVNGKTLMLIELKKIKEYNKLTDIVINELDEYDGDFLIQSFDPRVIKKVKKINPSFECGLLITDKYPNKFYKFFINNLFFYYIKADFLSISKKLIHNKRIKKFSKKHSIFLWTVRNKKELNKYSNKYCFVCDNLPFN